jgi:hypothetical protein
VLVGGCGGSHKATTEAPPLTAPPTAPITAPTTEAATEPAPDPAPAKHDATQMSQNEHHGLSLYISDDEIGGIDGSTVISDDGLHAMYPSYYHVLKGTFDDDNPEGYRVEVGDGTEDRLITVFSEPSDPEKLQEIRLTSARFDIPGHSWRHGDLLADVDGIASCRCWEHHLSCYQPNTRWAVTVNQHCDFSGSQAIGADLDSGELIGQEILYITWVPTGVHDS